MVRRFALVVIALAVFVSLASCSFNPLGLLPRDDSANVSRERMAEIVRALNSQDAAALRGVFTEYALTEYSAEIDVGVEYMLSLFPDGDVVWQDPGGAPGVHDSKRDGKRARLVSSSYPVSSGGHDYSLLFLDFTVNEIDPDNVGIYGMGAVRRDDPSGSGQGAAFRSWAQSFDADLDVSGPPGVFIGDDGSLSRDRMAEIVDALNAHDSVALEGMFTKYARTEHSVELDEGITYLLSQFPIGDIVWFDEGGGSVVYERIDGDEKAILRSTFFVMSSDGVDYRFFFADFTHNTIDPDNVGIYAMGAVPVAGALDEVPEAFIYPWAGSFDVEASNPPGIYIPE
jgi:hypothetical protein